MSKHFLELRGAVDEVADKALAFLIQHKQDQNQLVLPFLSL
jgi:hypothetical protein